MAQQRKLQKKAPTTVNNSQNSPEFLQTRPFASGVKSPTSSGDQETEANLQTRVDSTSSFAHGFENIVASPPNRSVIQPKLTIGEPGDKYEQEVDKVAAEVVQSTNQPEAVSSKPKETVQRQEMPEEEEPQMKPLVNTIQPGGGVAGMEVSMGLESAINSARRGGQPLDAGLQRSMGQAMGADFSGVKIHADSTANDLSESIQAKAFTAGQDVFFKRGAYDPSSKEGQELIAHELTHTVQQTGNTVQCRGDGVIQRRPEGNWEKAENYLEFKCTDDRYGIEWFGSMGWFYYKIVNQNKYQESDLKDKCEEDTEHTELWWSKKEVLIPKFRPTIEDEYVYHITDQKWLTSIKKHGFKSAVARGQKMEAVAGGSTDTDWKENQEKKVRPKIRSFIEYKWLNLAKDIDKLTLRGNFISDEGKGESCKMEDYKEGLSGLDEDRKLIDKKYEQDVEQYLKYLSSNFGQENSVKEAKTEKLNSSIKKNEAEKISKKIYADGESHHLYKIAYGKALAEQNIEGMVASQHVYVFTAKDTDSVWGTYTKGKDNPVVIRMKVSEFSFLAQDTQEGSGYRSRDQVDGEEIEWIKADSKSVVMSKTGWQELPSE